MRILFNFYIEEILYALRKKRLHTSPRKICHSLGLEHRVFEFIITVVLKEYIRKSHFKYLKFAKKWMEMGLFLVFNPQSKLPLILVCGLPIPLLESEKFLGLRFQSNHSWTQPIKIIKVKCFRAINILKILAHPSKGCNRKTLLPLYQSLIRSILDYGFPPSMASPLPLNSVY